MATTKFIDIKVRSTSAEKNVDKLDGKMNKLGKTSGDVTREFSALSKIAVAIGSSLVVSQLTKYADSYANIQNQIRQTTNTTQGLEKSTSALLAVANRSRTEFASTAELYTQLNLSTANLNLSTDELLRLTETIGKSFSVSGKSAAESSGAIRQLGQAFSAGALRGDEFNSIAEGAPEIMRALQRSLSLTQGELREFAATGGITAEILVEALGGAAEVIDDKMGKATKTLAQNIQEANNNVTEFIGKSSTVKNVIGAAGEAIVTASNNLENIANAAVLLSSVFVARLVPGVISYTTATIASTAAQLTQTKAVTGVSAAMGVQSVALTRSAVAMNAFAGASRLASTALGFLGGPLGVALIAAAAIYTYSESADNSAKSSKLAASEIDKLSASFKGLSDNAKRTAQARALEDTNKQMQALRDELILTQAAVDKNDALAEKKDRGFTLFAAKAADGRDRIKEINQELDILSQKQAVIVPAVDTSSFEDRGNINTTVKTDKPKESSAFANSLALETEQLRLELALRKAITNQNITEDEASEVLRFTEKATRQQALFDAEIAKLGEDEVLKTELTAAFREQQLLTAQEFEANLTDVKGSATQDRLSMDQQELQSRISTLQGITGLMQTFTGKSKTASKALMLIQGGLSAYQIYAASEAAAALALAQPPGPPTTIPFAAAISTKGKLNAAAVFAGAATGAFSSSSGGGSSSGGSVSASLGAASSPASESFTPEAVTENTQITALINELNQRDPDEPLSVDFTRRIVTAISENQSSGQA